MTKELFDHFSRDLQQGQPAGQAMPTTVPSYITSHTDGKVVEGK